MGVGVENVLTKSKNNEIKATIILKTESLIIPS